MEENSNPKIVVDAIIDAPKAFGKATIGDVTILKYAYLEKLRSPFIDGTQEFNVENIVPTVFVLASDKQTLRKYGNDIEKLKADALDWADDSLSLEDVPDVIKEVVSKLTSINKAAPSGSDSDPKKK